MAPPNAVHSDHLNTPRKLMNADGQAVWQWSYSAFGEDKPTLAKNRFANLEVTPNPGTTSLSEVKFNLRYPGQYADEESGLFYNYFRSYDSRTGRYSQPDPIGLQGGWSRFSYGAENPLLFTDPMGLLTLDSWWEASKAGFQSGMNDPWGEVGKAFDGLIPGEGAAVNAIGRGVAGLKSCFGKAVRANSEIGPALGWTKNGANDLASRLAEEIAAKNAMNAADVQKLVKDGFTKTQFETLAKQFENALSNPLKNHNELLRSRLEHVNKAIGLWPH